MNDETSASPPDKVPASNQKFCTACGSPIHASATACPKCGAQQVLAAPPFRAAPQGGNPSNPLPDGIKGWSWGAFWLNWIWAIGNKTWIGLLALLPVLNLVMPFVLGAKGREWAWKNDTWDSVEHFNKVQRKWSIAGWIVLAAGCVLGIALGIGFAIMQERAQHSSSADDSATTTQEEHAGNESFIHDDTAAHQAEPSESAAESPYPLPHLTFSQSDLLEAMKRAGVEITDPGSTNVAQYLSQPQAYWQSCVSQMAKQSELGGYSGKEAQEYGISGCKGIVRQYHDCLNDKPLNNAAMCLKGVVEEQNISE